MQKPLILVGAGGHCKSVIDAALSAGFEIAGILDMPEKVGEKILGIPVIGTDDDIPKYARDYRFVITVGQIKSCATRRAIARRIEAAEGEYATVIASSATVSRFAEICEGSVVLHGAHINADARIGRNCIINTGAIIEHDVDIQDFTHVSTGVCINGNASVGAESFIGSGSVINQGVSICEGVVIGSGSVVISDILLPGTYIGTPTKQLL